MKNNFLTKLYYTFFLSKQDRILLKYFFRTKKKTNSNEKILVQCLEDYYYYTLFGTIINSIKIDKNIHVEQYIPRNLSVGASTSVAGFFKSFLLYNKFRDNKWVKLYNSYCDDVAFYYESSSSYIFNIKAFFRAYKIFKMLNSKQEVLEIEIDDIKIGDLVYDSYLRYKPAPTVDVNDFYLCIVLWQSIRDIHIAKSYFSQNKIEYFLTSYSSYIHHGITVRVALDFGVSVYSFGDYGLLYQQLTLDYPYHAKNCRRYKKDFDKQQDSYDSSIVKKALNARFSGKIDVSTSYMKESAYKIQMSSIPDVKAGVVIFLHDFFDSPHIYEEMLFPDFYEWFEYTINFLNRNKINFFIKSHPNEIDDSKKVTESLKKKYQNLKFLSPKITNKQLVDGGIVAGVSVYGTVAHELTYLGIPVVLCGENPHSSYSFTFLAKNLDEYDNYLKNIHSLKLPIDAKEQVESFYFMHNLNHSLAMSELLKELSKLRELFEDDSMFNYNQWEKSINKINKNREFIKYINLLREKNENFN